MYAERVVIWCVRLQMSDLCKDYSNLKIKVAPASKTEIEKILRISYRNKEFDKFFKEMCSKNVLEFVGLQSTGKRNNQKAKVYTTSYSKIREYLETHEDETIRDIYRVLTRLMSYGRVI